METFVVVPVHSFADELGYVGFGPQRFGKDIVSLATVSYLSMIYRTVSAAAVSYASLTLPRNGSELSVSRGVPLSFRKGFHRIYSRNFNHEIQALNNNPSPPL